MDPLAAFGLLAVAAMLVTYALEKRSLGSLWPSPEHVSWAQLMGFCKAQGLLVSSKRSGPAWPFPSNNGPRRTPSPLTGSVPTMWNLHDISDLIAALAALIRALRRR
jgi:hypothetical protein